MPIMYPILVRDAKSFLPMYIASLQWSLPMFSASNVLPYIVPTKQLRIRTYTVKILVIYKLVQ